MDFCSIDLVRVAPFFDSSLLRKLTTRGNLSNREGKGLSTFYCSDKGHSITLNALKEVELALEKTGSKV
jgi:hypothetical protein